MKKCMETYHIKITMFSVALTLMLSICSANASDITLGSKEVLLDNEKIQMVRLVYPPNTESGMHSHQFSYRSIYVVAGGRLTLISADNEPSKTITVKSGQAMYLPNSHHNVKNVGETEVILIETELK
ncbi:MAG: cupin domain-containing protein [Thalassotalea sp.]